MNIVWRAPERGVKVDAFISTRKTVLAASHASPRTTSLLKRLPRKPGISVEWPFELRHPQVGNEMNLAGDLVKSQRPIQVIADLVLGKCLDLGVSHPGCSKSIHDRVQ